MTDKGEGEGGVRLDKSSLPSVRRPLSCGLSPLGEEYAHVKLRVVDGGSTYTQRYHKDEREYVCGTAEALRCVCRPHLSSSIFSILVTQSEVCGWV